VAPVRYPRIVPYVMPNHNLNAQFEWTHCKSENIFENVSETWNFLLGVRARGHLT